MSRDTSDDAEVIELRQAVDTLSAEVQAQRSRIQQLEEMLRLTRMKQFGPSSEQLAPGQMQLFDEADPDAEPDPAATEPNTVQVRAHSKRKPRSSLSDDLPRVEVVHELTEEQRHCAEHDCEMEPFGEETSEQLEFIPARVRVIRHICKKYRCPHCEGNLKTASKPVQPIPRSMATASLLAFIVISKYLDGLPLYRQCQIFSRIGFNADRTTLANWMMACGRMIQPLMNLLWERLREQSLVRMDETTVQVLDEPGRAPQTKSYMWVTVAGPPGQRTVLFHYAPSRGGPIPSELLSGFSGALMVDGYEGYDAVCKAQSLTRLGCWAHARRKFVEAQRAQVKGKSGAADVALSSISKLYLLERAIKELAPAQRHARRQQEAVPILDQLRKWLEKNQPRTAPKTALGKAMTYLANQWPRLTRYVEDGAWPIDNNMAENAIRPFVIGRKNWLFSQSARGASASANLYSLIETAKGHGLEPLDYLNHVFETLPGATNVDDIEALLPENFKGVQR